MRHLSQVKLARQDFLVVDTEGSKELSEIAIFDHRGKLIYEAFTQGHPNNTDIRQNLKTLQEIAADVTVLAGGVGQISPSKPLVCHYAKHDAGVLKCSFQKASIPWQNFAIRPPNNADAVLYHIYARILASLSEKVLGGDSTQLELLLVNSFGKILNVEDFQKNKDIVTAL